MGREVLGRKPALHPLGANAAVTIEPRSSQFRLAPRARRPATGEQTVAVPLSRRDEEGVVKMIDRETRGAAPQQRAGAHGDLGVDWADAVGEARDDLVEPAAQRLGFLPTEKSTTC